MSSWPSESPPFSHFCDAIGLQMYSLPDWSKFLWDETFADGC